jgi:hypothetical protein
MTNEDIVVLKQRIDLMKQNIRGVGQEFVDQLGSLYESDDYKIARALMDKNIQLWTITSDLALLGLSMVVREMWADKARDSN